MNAIATRPIDGAALRPIIAGHLAVDMCQGAVPAMLPFLVQERGLSYAAAGGLVLAQTVSSSVVQPIFGQLSDRRPVPWLMPAGVLTAGAGVAAASLLPTYPLIWAAIAGSGIGIAAFHPDGARYAGFASGDRRPTGMSYFSLGGNAGFASGPILTTPLLLWLGLAGGPLLLLPVITVALALAARLGRIDGHRAAARGSRVLAGKDDWRAFGGLTVAVLARSVAFYGLNTFVPLYWIGVLHTSKAAAGVALAAMLVAGAVGTVLGGRSAERWGKKAVVVVSLGGTGPLILLLLLARDPLLATLLLVPLALTLQAAGSILVLLGQEYLPNRVGMASGVTLGLALSFGGLFTPAVGWVGDRHGLPTAVALLAALPLIALPFAAALPGSLRRRRDAAL